jgi:hypothetical protein
MVGIRSADWTFNARASFSIVSSRTDRRADSMK